jgi:hypothetical protein
MVLGGGADSVCAAGFAYKAFFTRSLESPSVEESTSHESKQDTDESTIAQLILYIAYDYIKHK